MLWGQKEHSDNILTNLGSEEYESSRIVNNSAVFVGLKFNQYATIVLERC